VAALVACVLVPIWTPAWFPSQNGPWFLLPTHMFKEYGNPAFNYAEYFVRNWHPIPHMLHDALVGLVSFVAPLATAEKIVLSLNALMLPASLFALLSVVGREFRFLACLGFVMALGYPFFRGYHDFTLSVSLFFFMLAYWMRHRSQLGPRQAAALNLLAVLVWLSHLFTFALLAGVVGWIRLFETKRLSQAFVAALQSTWPGWLLTADYLWLNSQASWIDHSDTEWLPLHWIVENFAREMFRTVSEGAYVISVLTWSWAAYFLWRGWRRSGATLGETIRTLLRHPLSSLIIFLCIAYLALPYKVIGWHKVNTRLIPFILGLTLAGIACLPLGTIPQRLKRTFLGVMAAAMVAISSLLTAQVMEMERMVAEYVSGIEQFEPNARLLPIHLDNPAFGAIRPITRAHEYYHIAKGGANGESIPSLNTLSVMWYRNYPVSEEFPPYSPDDPTSLQKIRGFYDYVLIFGEDADEARDSLEQLGFRAVHRQGRLTLLRRIPMDRDATRTAQSTDAILSSRDPST
jgi:hypothetical protein